MANARLAQHAKHSNDMATAIRNKNYGLTITKYRPLIGRFALHALEAAEIWSLRAEASSAPRGYLAANVVLPTTRETLNLQFAGDLHHRWITDDLITDLPERHSPKSSPTMRTDRSFQPTGHLHRIRVPKRKPQPKRQCKRL